DTAKLRELLDACKGALSVGTGKASGKNRAVQATETAMSSVFTHRGDYDRVSSALVSICGSPDLCMHEYDVIVKTILGKLPNNTSFLMGVTADSILQDSIQVTVLLG
ncbi:MAG: hypothetical protein JZU65_03170, partial [Chlorobium sp.]|nr:hypothetical protein [Chlorobium sp.]